MSAYFRDKTLMITGAASGIGRQLAMQSAAMGARLVLVDIDAEGLVETERLCRAGGARVVQGKRCDVSRLDAMQQMFKSLPPELAAVDVLFANAGVSFVTQMRGFSPEMNQKIMSINYTGSVNAVSLVLPSMLALGSGHLVAISSLAGYRGLPGSACYGAAKAAQAVFFEGLRIDLRGKGPKVSVVFPGFVDTPINKPLHELYHLPFMITAESAARRILRGVSRGRTHIAFPLPSRWMGKVSKILPNPIYDFFVSLNPYKKKSVPPQLQAVETERKIG